MGDYIPIRVIISILIFIMFIIINICNTVLHITILSMVDRRNSSSNAAINLDNSTSNDHKLQWDTLSIAIVQGAYFWGFCASKLPGGMLARRYGTRKVLATAVFITTSTSCIFPTAAKIHPILASIVRAIIGLANGTTWPATMNLAAKWIPKNERSLFSNTIHGNGIGIAIFYPISGLIIEYYGWESVFYIGGMLGFIWLILWSHFAYDSPDIHPTISFEEKTYIENDLKAVIKTITKNEKDQKMLPSIPWKSILTSKPFWATAVYSHGSMWFYLTMNLQQPRYFIQTHKLNVKASGFIIGLPELLKLLVGVTFGYYMDYLLKKEKFSLTTIRKFGVIPSKIIPAILLLILASVTTYDYRLSILLITSVSALSGTSTSSGFGNLNDIAPNFASVITGLIQSTIGIPGVLSPILFSTILLSNPNNGWFWIFLIVASIELFTGIIFIIFGSGKVQPWNEPKIINVAIKSTELQTLVNIKS